MDIDRLEIIDLGNALFPSLFLARSEHEHQENHNQDDHHHSHPISVRNFWERSSMSAVFRICLSIKSESDVRAA